MHDTAGTYNKEDAKVKEFVDSFTSAELDDAATESTLGIGYKSTSPQMLLHTTAKLLSMSRGKDKPDVKDSLEYQRVYGAHDFLADRIAKDPGYLARNVLWKVTNKGTLKGAVPSAVFDKHITSTFNDSGLNQMLEGINPLEQYDLNYKITRMGPGGITSMDSVPDEARQVQNSYLGYIDPIRSPESLRIGVDNYLTVNTRFSPDGQLWQKLYNTRTKKEEWVKAAVASTKNVAFPETMGDKTSKTIPVLNGKAGLRYVKRGDVDYIVPHHSRMFSAMTGNVPMFSGVKGMRLLMGSKMGLQALPLLKKESPYVSNKTDNGKAVSDIMGKISYHITADDYGKVTRVTKDAVEVMDKNGKKKAYQLYRNFPHARKTYTNSFPQVKAGDIVKKGQTIALSNYNDASGKLATGVNLNSAYIPWKGFSHEDGVVISESAAKKLTSEQMYTTKYRKDKNIDINKRKFVSIFPGKYEKKILDNFDDDGIIRPGTVVNMGDPLLLAVKTRAPEPGTLKRKLVSDTSATWEHHSPGVVTDVSKTRDGYRVFVRSMAPAQEGDKLSGRFGNKGVISKILPDNEMPVNTNGEPVEIMLNPVGIVSRTNSAQLAEAALGKIAARTGKRYDVEAFDERSLIDYAEKELEKHGMKDTEDIKDPVTGRIIPQVFTGNAYFYKLQHMADAKQSSRALGGYTQDQQPGSESKRIGGMEVAALVSHGVPKVLKDMKLIKGQQNDEYWRQIKLGYSPRMPDSIFMYQKFRNQIKAAGVNLYTDERGGDNIFAMTQNDVNKLTAGREVKTGDTYDPKTLQPLPGGLFGQHATGGAEGNKFSYIQLDEPVLNPVMEGPVKRILGLTSKQFDDVIAGRLEYKNKKGGNALKAMLDDVDINKEILTALDDIRSGSASNKDKAVKKLRALQSLKDHDVKPSDFMLTKVPVLPPVYRPITVGSDMNMVADVNFLYRDLIHARDDLREGRGILPSSELQNTRENLYKNFKSLVGLADPVNKELQQKGVGGILKSVFGKGSPKRGQFQRKMVGSSQDLTGRGVITPNPNLKLNEVGLPENIAWKIYEPFIIRDLVRSGYASTDAVRQVADRTERANASLRKVVNDRPVLINRAPTLHKFSIMALKPVLVKSDNIQVSNFLLEPFNADYDGDTTVLHVPVSEEAVREARAKMTPDANLLSARSHGLLWKPTMDYVLGAHFATKPPKPGVPRVFPSARDAVVAYRRGEIDIDTPIRIEQNGQKRIS